MKRILLFFTVVLMFVATGSACTNFIVGKKASADGSVFVSYSADSYGMSGFIAHFPAAVHPAGAMRDVYDWDSGVFLGQIAEAPVTYNVLGNINEHQVAIGETTFGGRPELVDTTGIIDYGSLIYITLQRSKSAREAIDVMTSLVAEYGYYSSGESFSIADPNEVWILEMIGKGGKEKGAVWVAVRIPDDCISAHANQARIRKFDMNDKENVRYSKDVIKFARKMGYFDGKDADFDFAAAYCPADFGGLRYCDARVWSFFNMFADADMSKYIAWASGDATAEPMPLYMKPKAPMSLQDVQRGMRDHYEGTPFDITQDVGAGPYNTPYRVSPLSCEVDGKTYFNERPISTFQTAFTFVAQLRSFMPDAVGGVMWYGTDDSNMVVYTPVYCCATTVPDCYARAYADPVEFSWKSSFWVFNWVANMIYPKYSMVIDDMRQVQGELEKTIYEQSRAFEAEVLEVVKLSPKYAVQLLTDFTCSSGEYALEEWKKFGEKVIVKYNDFVVKSEKDGKIQHSKTGLVGKMTRPGYTKEFWRSIAEQTGDRYLVPAAK
ncbi:MAG: C69 family dipeptidase [Bacteroidaceae bacterium]|nr:C69 family dipeptidase [Bacteroidaceae bacterium]